MASNPAKVSLKHAGAWKEPDKIWLKNAGVWKEPIGAWVKSGGVWEKFWPKPPLGFPAWRVFVTDTAGNSFFQWSEIWMMDTIGGANQCVGGAAYANNVHLNTPAAAFDGDTSATYLQQSVPGPGNWVAYLFPAAKLIKELKLFTPNLGGNMPKAFKVQYSANTTNGADGVWVDVWSVVDQVAWTDYLGAPVQRRYVDPAYWAYPKNMYRVTCSNGGGNAVRVSAFELRIGGVDQAVGEFGCPSAVSAQSGLSPRNAFDGDPATTWGSSFGFGSLNRWLRYDFPEGKLITQFALRSESGSGSLAPTSGIFEESSDGIAWRTVASFSGVTWAAGETKVFNRTGTE